MPRSITTVLAGFLGAAFLYAAVFLYEDEERKIQNKLEEYWLKVDDSRIRYSSAAGRFIRSVASLTTRLLNRLFGPRFVSFQALFMSACLAIASTCVFLTLGEVLFLILYSRFELIPHIFLVRSCFIASVIAFAALPLLIRPAALRPYLSLALLIAAIIAMPLIPQSTAGWAHTFYPRLPVEEGGEFQQQVGLASDYVIAFVTLVIALVSSTIFLILTRYLLRWVASSRHAFLSCMVLVFNLALSVALVVVPPGVLGQFHDPIFDPIQPAGLDIGGSNLGNAVAACLFFGAGLLFGLHHLFWPVISRAVYAMQGIGIARRRKLFSSIGGSLLAYSGISLPASVKEVLQILISR